ncbi:hypothetical protein DOY81_004361 [Sarcophaga bullata]|nr:hypothetical protein DOY81_004361 [Sarcophaga bullata]
MPCPCGSNCKCSSQNQGGNCGCGASCQCGSNKQKLGTLLSKYFKIIKEQENTRILNQFTSEMLISKVHHLLIGTTLAVSATLAISALVL